MVGNGENTKFWTDRWINGQSISTLAPNLLQSVSRQAVRNRTVAQALQNRAWVADIVGSLTVQVIIEYLRTWELVDEFALQPEVPDKHIWKLSKTGTYSSKSAYEAFFVGTIKFAPWRRIWRTWAPMKCRFFIWLAVLNRCWTAERLAKVLGCPTTYFYIREEDIAEIVLLLDRMPSKQRRELLTKLRR